MGKRIVLLSSDTQLYSNLRQCNVGYYLDIILIWRQNQVCFRFLYTPLLGFGLSLMLVWQEALDLTQTSGDHYSEEAIPT